MNSQERAGILIGKILGLLPYDYKLFEPKSNSLARRTAEATLGRSLLPDEEVHHKDKDRSNNEPSNLVVCKNHLEHMLLHRRQDALEACGHADWRRCAYYGKYDSPENLFIPSNGYKPHHKRHNYKCLSMKE